MSRAYAQFMQLYTIYGFVKKICICLVYFFMTRQIKELYIAIFTKLCDVALKSDIELNFKFASTDVEQASISAF